MKTFMNYFPKFILFIFFALNCAAGKNDFTGKDPSEVGASGFEAYEEGNYAIAAPQISYALDNGFTIYADSYADICKRELDGQKHKLSEAARWYLTAARGGDPDAFSYLHSLDERLVDFKEEESSDFTEKIALLKRCWYVEERRANADKGYHFYCLGEYKTSARYLKRAARGNHPLAQEVYADICYRRLDGGIHPLKESAMWYLLAARGGASDSFSYLSSFISQAILQEIDPKQTLESIVAQWVKDQTLLGLKKIMPITVVNWMSFQGCEITKTCAMKLPYFFDKVFAALFYTFGIEPKSSFDEEPIPQPCSNTGESAPKRPKTCREELSKRFTSVESAINCAPAPMIYGNTYPSLFKVLEPYTDDKSQPKPLPKPEKEPDLNPIIYRDLLAAFVEVFGKNASTLTELSHEEHPWILAGISYWKAYHKKEFTLSKGRLRSESEIIKHFETYGSLDGPEIEFVEILEKIDGREEYGNAEIWKHGYEIIDKEYAKAVKRYFSSEVSCVHSDVRKVLRIFLSNAKERSLNLSEPYARKVLETPFLMHLCESLTLEGLKDNKTHHNLLGQAAHYLSNLKTLKVKSLPRPAKEGSELHRILRKLAKFGVEIKIEPAPDN